MNFFPLARMGWVLEHDKLIRRYLEAGLMRDGMIVQVATPGPGELEARPDPVPALPHAREHTEHGGQRGGAGADAACGSLRCRHAE